MCSQHYNYASYLLSSDSKALMILRFAVIAKLITFKVIKHQW